MGAGDATPASSALAELRRRYGLTDARARDAIRAGLSAAQILELKRLDNDPAENEPFQSSDERVRALPPADRWRDPYWRLEYDQHGRRRQPSGGRTRASAERKMALELRRLDAGLDDDLPRRRGSEVLDAWLAPGQPHKGGRPWSAGSRAGYTWYTNRYLRPVLGELRAEEWDRRAFRAVVNQAVTRKEGLQIRRRLSALLSWALTAGYLHENQVLALRAVQWQAPPGYAEKPERADRIADDDTQPVEDVMDAAALAAIGDALQPRYAHGKLFAEFAAATGLRQGELFAVSADDINLASRQVRVRLQFNSKTGELAVPKMGKRRTAVFVGGPTITGYDLPAALARRIQATKAEQANDANPAGLLFPAPRGGYWSGSRFYRNCWLPAMAAAEVPFVEYADRIRTGKRLGEPVTRRMYRYTCHSLRDRFAVSALNLWKFELDELQVVGGWTDSEVIFRRYYGVAKGVLERVAAKTAR
ncbi:MAG TPA: tyrosine-type recombinase/integrase [Gaiellales bacterium]|nr:tyrosine-type recombinase/integrase [Gaiellales bacterium]